MSSISGFSKVPAEGEPEEARSASVAKTYEMALPSSLAPLKPDITPSYEIKNRSWLADVDGKISDPAIRLGQMLAFALINQKLEWRVKNG